MSQRLHIGEITNNIHDHIRGKTTNNIYDCILTTGKGAKEKLLEDWVVFKNGFYLGPLKITISDYDLWKEVEGIVSDVCGMVNEVYPDDIGFFRRESVPEQCMRCGEKLLPTDTVTWDHTTFTREEFNKMRNEG